MAIAPDTKDWTWVLQRRCPECGYVASATTRPAVPGLIRENAAAWEAALLRRNWDQDATAVADQYQDQDPGVVSGQLTEAAHRIARRFAGLTDAQWERTGSRSDGARFTVDSFARYLIHDPVHHLHDVGG